MVTADSRTARARAQFFLEKAAAAGANERTDFEAYVDACLVFGRAAIDRARAVRTTDNSSRAIWDTWWRSVENTPAVLFFRENPNYVLHQGPLKIGQKIFAPTIGINAPDIPASTPDRASGFYFFPPDPASVPATDTVARHLAELTKLLQQP